METAAEDADAEEISESHALANKKGVDKEVLLQDVRSFIGSFEGFFNVLLVVRIAANDWSEIIGDVGEHFRVHEGHPSYYRGVVLLGLA